LYSRKIALYWVRLGFGKEVNNGATTINPMAMLRRITLRAVLIGFLTSFQDVSHLGTSSYRSFVESPFSYRRDATRGRSPEEWKCCCGQMPEHFSPPAAASDSACHRKQSFHVSPFDGDGDEHGPFPLALTHPTSTLRGVSHPKAKVKNIRATTFSIHDPSQIQRALEVLEALPDFHLRWGDLHTLCRL
jgi:hypothetical protein